MIILNEDGRRVKHRSIADFFDAESIEAAEFSRLHSNMIKTAKGNLKSVLITSCAQGEGKSVTASLLAATIAHSGSGRILLLDADMRRSSVHGLFHLPLGAGFADLLKRKKKVSETLRETPIPGLRIITAGKADESPSSLLDKAGFREIIQELEVSFDLVVVDGPPLIPVSDPLIISDEVDGTLLVVRAGRTPRDVVTRGIKLLANSRIDLLGVVLNDYEEVLPYYYKPHYYGYASYWKRR